MGCCASIVGGDDKKNDVAGDKPVDAWMGYVADQCPNFRDKTFAECFIPGTHDSGTWDMSGLGTVMAPWAKTQDDDFYETMMKGCRYIDARLDYAGGDFLFEHGPAKTEVTLKNLLDQLEKFYDEPSHAREVVILDFTHFGENFQQDKGAEDQSTWTEFVAAIESHPIYAKFAMRTGTTNDDGGCSAVGVPTLGSLWDAGTPIICSFAWYMNVMGNPERIFQGHEIFIGGWAGAQYWCNCNALDDLKPALGEHLKTDYGDRIWILQTMLTAAGEGFTRTLHDMAKEETNPWLIEELANNDSEYRKANIVEIDYFDAGLTARAIDLNIQRCQ